MNRFRQVLDRSFLSCRAPLTGALVVALVCRTVSSFADSREMRAPDERTGLDTVLVVQLDKDLKERQAGGSRFPVQRTSTDTRLAVVASLDVRPIAIAISGDDRLFISLAAHLGDTLERDSAMVREVLPDGTLLPFPFTSSRELRPQPESFSKVMALEVDSEGVLWILDSGTAPTSQPKLVGWDLKKEALHRLIYLPAPITKPNSSLVSLVVDEKRTMAFIADQGRSDFVGKSEPAIISVDLKTGVAWRALEDHYSLNADGGDFIVKGEPLLAPDGKGSLVRPGLGIVSVASDDERNVIYFGAANGRSVFRISSEALSDPKISSAQVGERVERLGDKPPSHGLLALAHDQLMISDVNNNAIGVVGPAGRYEMLATSEDLSWPTAFARGRQGEVYVVSSQFHRAPLFHQGEDRSARPFIIARFYPRITRREPQRTPSVADSKKRRPGR